MVLKTQPLALWINTDPSVLQLSCHGIRFMWLNACCLDQGMTKEQIEDLHEIGAIDNAKFEVPGVWLLFADMSNIFFVEWAVWPCWFEAGTMLLLFQLVAN